MSHGGWNIGNHCVHSVSARSQYVLFTVSMQALKVHRRQTCDNVALTHSPPGVGLSHSLTGAHTHRGSSASYQEMHQAFDCLHGSTETDEIGCEGSRKVPACLRTSCYLIDSRRVQQSVGDGVIAKDTPLPLCSSPNQPATTLLIILRSGQWWQKEKPATCTC